MSAFPILSRFQQDAHIKTVEIDPVPDHGRGGGRPAPSTRSTFTWRTSPAGRFEYGRPPTTILRSPGRVISPLEQAGIRFYDCIDIYFEEP